MDASLRRSRCGRLGCRARVTSIVAPPLSPLARKNRNPGLTERIPGETSQSGGRSKRRIHLWPPRAAPVSGSYFRGLSIFETRTATFTAGTNYYSDCFLHRVNKTEYQHVSSKSISTVICGGTRTQFRCVGARGWRRRRWRRRGRRGRRWQWSRWSERRIRNHRQLDERPEQRSERQQRYSTLRRPKRSEGQWRCSIPRQHGPKQYQLPRDGSWAGEHWYEPLK
jgi:hypothetical protein